MPTNYKYFAIAFTAIALAGTANAGKLEDLIAQESRKTSAKSKDHAITYRSLEITLTSPFVAYLVKFDVKGTDFNKKPGAHQGNKEYITNQGISMIWQTAFCTPEMKSIAVRYKLMINGALFNDKGENQFTAICTYYD